MAFIGLYHLSLDLRTGLHTSNLESTQADMTECLTAQSWPCYLLFLIYHLMKAPGHPEVKSQTHEC